MNKAPETRKAATKRPVRLDDEVRFLRSWIEKPLRVGHAMPSSKALARTMAQYVDINSTGPVIELGSGTGAITKALIEHGVDQKRLVLVESNPGFCKLLRERYPKAIVVEGDAYALRDSLRDVLSAPASAVVSGLPLVTKPMHTRLKLIRDAFITLAPEAPFIQFTYSVLPPIPKSLPGVSTEASERIWMNLPPARVWVYRRGADLTPLKATMNKSENPEKTQAIEPKSKRTHRELLESAITHYRKILAEHPREKDPVAWAGYQHDLGDTLVDLALEDGNTSLLHQAEAAFTTAIEISENQNMASAKAESVNALHFIAGIFNTLENISKFASNPENPYAGKMIPGRVADEISATENVKDQARKLSELLRELTAHGVSQETCDRVELEITNEQRPHWLPEKDRPAELRGLTAPQFLKLAWADKLRDGQIRRDLLKDFDSDLLQAVDVYLSARKARNLDAGDAIGITLIATKQKAPETTDKKQKRPQPKKRSGPAPRL